MSMPTKGSKHHHLSHHHHQQHHPQQQPPPPPAPQQQAHHTSSHQHQIILNQPVHSAQTYSAVVTTNNRFLNTGKSRISLNFAIQIFPLSFSLSYFFFAYYSFAIRKEMCQRVTLVS